MARRSKNEAKKTRETLLAEAAYLFETLGYSAASVDDICARAGTTKGALFYHFTNKKALFLEIWTNLQKRMDVAAREAAIAARSATDPYSSFMAGCRVYLDWAVRRDYQTIVIIDGPSVLGQAGWYESDHNLGIQNVEAGLQYLARKGIIAQRRVAPLAVMTQGALNGAGFAMARGDVGITPENAYEAFEAMVKNLR